MPERAIKPMQALVTTHQLTSQQSSRSGVYNFATAQLVLRPPRPRPPFPTPNRGEGAEKGGAADNRWPTGLLLPQSWRIMDTAAAHSACACAFVLEIAIRYPRLDGTGVFLSAHTALISLTVAPCTKDRSVASPACKQQERQARLF